MTAKMKGTKKGFSMKKVKTVIPIRMAKKKYTL